MDDYAQRIGDLEEMLRLVMDGRQAAMHTGQPGIIVSYNSQTQTAVVQPAIQGRVTLPDGTLQNQTLPVIPDVPVSFPGGGGVTLTFPVKAGDEVWLAHGHRDFSAWWQQGGIQPTSETRMHDLTDCVAHLGIRSQARKLSKVSGSMAQLQSDDGSLHIELDTAAGVLRLTAANAIELNAPNVFASGELTIKAGTLALGVHAHQGTGPPLANATNPGPGDAEGGAAA